MMGRYLLNEWQAHRRTLLVVLPLVYLAHIVGWTVLEPMDCWVEPGHVGILVPVVITLFAGVAFFAGELITRERKGWGARSLAEGSRGIWVRPSGPRRCSSRSW